MPLDVAPCNLSVITRVRNLMDLPPFVSTLNIIGSYQCDSPMSTRTNAPGRSVIQAVLDISRPRLPVLCIPRGKRRVNSAC